MGFIKKEINHDQLKFIANHHQFFIALNQLYDDEITNESRYII